MAAIVGALIGAGVSYWVALQTSKANDRSVRKNSLEDEKMRTYRMGLKILELTNAAAGYYLATEKNLQLAKAQVENEDIELWLVMKPFIGKPNEIRIDENDMLIFWRARSFDFISKLFQLVSNYNAMIYNVEEFSKYRNNLMAKIIPETMNGLIGTIYWTEEQHRQLLPEIETVKDLAEQVRIHMKEIYDESLRILDEFKPIVRTYFKDPKFPVPGLVSTKVSQP